MPRDRRPSWPARRVASLAERVRCVAERPPLGVPAPLTGRMLGSVPLCEPDDVREAATRARAAQPAWEARPIRERVRVFRRLHGLLLRHRDEIMDLVQLETGKSRRDAFEELADTAMVCAYYSAHARRHLRPRRRRGAIPGLTRTMELQRPYALCGVISPANYPLTMAVADAVPALIAGCAVLVKPDPRAPFSSLLAGELLEEARLPRDLYQVVTGPGDVGAAVVDAVDFVAFTGGTETGRRVAERAGSRLVDCSLELGGKNALLVLHDADLDAAIAGAARGAFANAGQLCIGVERILVDRVVHEEFVARLVERVREMRIGAGLDWEFEVGSLGSEQQFETVRGQLEDALSKGATVLVGGRARPDLGPWFFEPTLLAGVGPGMRVYDQETFGPIAWIDRFQTEEEAVRRVNESRYGLSASIWSEDPKRARQLAERLDVGTVNINEAYGAAYASVDSPMGGFKDSGMGRRHGAEGIRRYTRPQTISRQRLHPLAPSRLLPPRRFAWLFSGWLRLARHIPGLR